MRVFCPAKLNLSLEILGARGDGYHEVRLTNLAVNLCDELELRTADSGISVECDHPRVPADQTNLAARAAEAFFTARPEARTGLFISIRKKIPVAGGLGGGSANAAAVLWALNRMRGSPLGREELMALGSEIGSDVPFFLFSSPAVARGRGERLEPAGPVPDWTFALAGFSFGVDTAWAYRAWDLTNNPKQDTFNFSKTVDLLPGPELFRNDLFSVVSSRHPDLIEVIKFFEGEGARGAMMSGSGPTVFGAFEEEWRARRAVERLAGLFAVEAVVVRPIRGEILSTSRQF